MLLSGRARCALDMRRYELLGCFLALRCCAGEQLARLRCGATRGPGARETMG